MIDKVRLGGFTGWLLGAASCVVVLAGMRAAQELLVPLLLSLFLAVICAPPLFWLQRRGLPSGLAAVAIILAVTLAQLGVVAVVATSLTGFMESLPRYQESLQSQFAGLLAWLRSHGVTVASQDLLKYLNPGSIMRLAGVLVSGLGAVLTNTFMILLTVIFLLLEASSFPEKLRSVSSDPDGSMPQWNKVAADIQHYVALKTWVSLGTGLAVYLWLAILGVDFALLWGLLAFLLNYVPNIGSIMAALPGVLLALVQLGWSGALAAAGGYLVINLAVGSIIEPRIMGRRLGLSTLVVFLSLVFWGWVLGPVGMVLSVPLTMAVKIGLESYGGTRALGVILGAGPPAEPPRAA